MSLTLSFLAVPAEVMGGSSSLMTALDDQRLPRYGKWLTLFNGDYFMYETGHNKFSYVFFHI